MSVELSELRLSRRGNDLEAGVGPDEFVEGYVDFAEFIASDNQLSIYRRFSSLGARNLLYLQAELQLLQFELQTLDQADQAVLTGSGGGEEKKAVEDAAKVWECFKQQAKHNPRQAEKMRMILKLRSLMDEYRTHPVPPAKQISVSQDKDD
jgi:hypothetical protein